MITLVLTILVTTAYAGAVTIQYTATDLPDNDPNQDLWQYSYQVSDYTFSQGIGFTIYFELGLYNSLSPVSSPEGWDVISWNPDPDLPGDGAYDAQAIVDNPSLNAPFVVEFVWLGNESRPGAQPFEIYEIYDDDNLHIIETGTTIPAPVPLPSTLLLLLSGAAGLCWEYRLHLKRS